MAWERIAHILILLLSTVMAASLAYIAWRRRLVPAALEFALFSGSAAVWALSEAAQVWSPAVAAKLTYTKLGYLGIATAPVFFYLFIHRMCVPAAAPMRRRIGLFIASALVIGIVWTNEWHSLHYTQVALVETAIGVLGVFRHGPFFWIFVAYSYLLLSAGTVLLLRTVRRASGLHRRRLSILALGTLIPWLGNAAYIFGLIPIPGLDFTPIAFALAGAVYGWAIFRLELLQLTPAARAMLVERMSDGVLVLDGADRVVDANPAARRLLAHQPRMIGVTAQDLLAPWTRPDGRPPDVAQMTEQIAVTADGAHALELRMSPLTDRTGEMVGRLVILRDVTEQRRADQALRESQRVYATLLSNLPGMAYRCLNDPAWSMTFVSQGSLELTGYPPEDLQESRRISYAALVHEDDRERVWNGVQAAVQCGQPFQMIYRIIAASGEEKWVWEQGQAVCGPAGDVVALEGFIADFTERIRAEHAEQEERQFAEALREAAAVVAGTLDRDEVLDRILAQVSRVLSCDAAAIYLIEGREARVVRSRGLNAAQEASLASLTWDVAETPNMRAMIEMRQSVVVRDTRADPAWIRTPQTAWVASHAGAPICSHETVFGFLELDSAQPGFYGPQDGERLRAFADQAALALQNARLFDETRRRAEQMTMLNRIGLAIAAGLSMEQVLHAVYEQCLLIAPVDSFYVALYDPSTGDIRFPVFRDRDQYIQMPNYNVRTQPGMAGAVIAEARTLYLPDTLDPQATAAYQISHVGSVARTYLGIPLTLRERVIGVLSVQHLELAAFSAEQIHLFEMLATQAVIAIDNAQLYELARNEQQYLEALIANTPGGIVVIDAEGRVKRWSLAAERIFGYTSAEAIGHNIDLLVAIGSPQMLREGTRLTATAFGEDRVAHIVTQRVRKDGSLVDVEIYGTPNAAGAEYEMILSYYDVSELQAARAALEQSNQTLQQHLDELNRANADLQARNEELDAFAHTVAHDLRSPLGNITGYADLLRWDAGVMSGAEVADLALEMLQQGRRMRNIIDELLLLAGMRKDEVRLEPIEMGEVVAEASARLADQIARSEAEIHLPPSWPVAQGYAPWIEEVWANLLSNALTYGGQPPVIELGGEPWGDAQIRFWVRDNGPGIAAEVRQYIFLPFTRLSQAHSSSYGPGPFDRATDHHQARRRGRRGERTGARQFVLLYIARRSRIAYNCPDRTLVLRGTHARFQARFRL
jgi:PAS domain S-box-containing protein